MVIVCKFSPNYLTKNKNIDIISIGGRMKNKISSILILLTIWIIPLINVNAKTISDMDNELAQLQKSYNAAKNKANMTQAELNKVKANISSTEAEIKNTQNEIIKAENDIQESEKSIEEKKEQTNQMLLYLQLAGKDESYLNYLFEADDYTEFIYRYSVVSQLSDYNQKLMDELNTLIEKLQDDKKNMAEKQTQLEQKKSELQSQYAIIQVQYKSDQDDGIDLQEQINQMKKEIKAAETRCGGNRNINVNSCSGAAAAVDGWTYPLKHFYQSSIYAESRGDVRHYAVDLAISEGNNVYAVANGTVKSVTTSTCGGMVIQIAHYYKGAWYRSLYMHLLTGYVQTGQTVTGGQVIGLSGGGSQEKAKWGDHCTEGAHLHFTMSDGESAILSSKYRGSTFDPVRFFPAMSGYGAKL